MAIIISEIGARANTYLSVYSNHELDILVVTARMNESRGESPHGDLNRYTHNTMVKRKKKSLKPTLDVSK